ncbi:MAG: galactose-6-phosphate isomerase subunit LacB [Clostridium sp.]|jgi:galactose-6-phosphate isomerase|uniref:galactose-6-phosphate isomerase subunit LacB n=1 Tax=Clostridium sp. TaxID=1506 RepID=UPI0025C30BCA|nr:galactose-6-phosphate isomerase subunit LacB [Clostridium sp.]MCH3964960.1 galactose-6-phosphate isomerase subunit LacB [Clostridium sp.]MCI1716546.1 galactose-6-phosphate isomerase subunit LacB [Clostridium sp.]MCI1800972.1 galactose-6-phosphate isomerase subunit LacB [Clostridium sp.]MCI1814723.1 galactose-6-phosphate isomerase subunit LacB [Clostridium sp.]MCI1871719.1 galactose-6-phosphate isomerase subunit LacB [Clostridium sp.]
MIISLGSDHIVPDIKMKISQYLKSKGHEVIDNGTYDFVRTHYPIFGKKTAEKVISKEADLGIVLCGTGVGISNSVNKVKGVRAALVRDVTTARYAKEYLNANVIAFGGRITGIGIIENIIDVFLESEYKPTKENIEIIKEIDGLISDDSGQFGNEHFFDEFIDKWNNGGYPKE